MGLILFLCFKLSICICWPAHLLAAAEMDICLELCDAPKGVASAWEIRCSGTSDSFPLALPYRLRKSVFPQLPEEQAEPQSNNQLLLDQWGAFSVFLYTNKTMRSSREGPLTVYYTRVSQNVCQFCLKICFVYFMTLECQIKKCITWHVLW